MLTHFMIKVSRGFDEQIIENLKKKRQRYKNIQQKKYLFGDINPLLVQ